MRIFLLVFASLIISTNLRAQIPAYVPQSGILAWYSFDGNTIDSSGNGNTLYNSGAVLTTDRFGNSNSAYLFNGTTSYMSLSSPSFTFGPDSSYTVSVWANKAGFATKGFPFWHGLLQNQTGGPTSYIHMLQYSQNYGLAYGTNKQGSAWIWCNSTYTTNTWDHWACVYNNHSIKLFKNGVLVSSNTFTHTGVTISNVPFFVGSNSAMLNVFDGKIDDIGVWNRALTVAEITSLYTSCSGPVYGPADTVVACDSYTSVNGTQYTSSGIYADTLTSINGCDSIVTLDLTILNSTGSSLAATECFEYVSPSGNHTWTSSGTYYDTLTNAMGCDSVITISLTINTVDVTVTSNSTTLAANATGATFQWLDCNNNLAPISGATSAAYTPTANGDYAVEVTQNSCVDTSLCYNISGVGIGDMAPGPAFQIFPNPTGGKFSIQSDMHGSHIAMQVFDITGRVVLDMVLTADELHAGSFDISGLEKGIYTVRLSSLDETASGMLILE